MKEWGIKKEKEFKRRVKNQNSKNLNELENHNN